MLFWFLIPKSYLEFRIQNRNLRNSNFDFDFEFLVASSSDFDSKIPKFQLQRCQNQNGRLKFLEVKIFAHSLGLSSRTRCLGWELESSKEIGCHDHWFLGFVDNDGWKLSKRELELVAIIFQNLWLRENSFVFDNILDSLKKMLRVVANNWKCFWLLQYLMMEKGCNKMLCSPWGPDYKKPVAPVLKFNCDGAVDSHANAMGLGGVLQ